MGHNKTNGSTCKFVEHMQPGHDPIGGLAGGIGDDCKLERAGASLFLDREINKSRLPVLRQLLSEANQEFAELLEDLCVTQSERETGRMQDGQINELLNRAVRCASNQFLLQDKLGGLAFTDELTGLLNRRGFMAITEHEMKIGRRSARGMIVFFMDVNGMKSINDTYGHGEGDRALQRVAQALEKTFRDSDVIARLGGDEFAVLAVEASCNSESAIRGRLSRALKSVSAGETRYKLSLSLGAARLELRGRSSMRKLMELADQSMYERKRRGSKWIPRPTHIRGRDHLLLPVRDRCGKMTQ